MNSIATLVIVSYCVLGALLLLVAIKRAPSGYEDENGFHLGAEPEAALARDRMRVIELTESQALREGARPPWPVVGVHGSEQHADAA